MYHHDSHHSIKKDLCFAIKAFKVVSSQKLGPSKTSQYRRSKTLEAQFIHLVLLQHRELQVSGPHLGDGQPRGLLAPGRHQLRAGEGVAGPGAAVSGYYRRR